MREAVDQEHHDLASEILISLEADTYHPEVTRLRRRIDQSMREKAVRGHIESARQRFEVREYELALQWVQKVLDLDAANPEALGLKDDIENRRRTQQIDEWLTLARQHVF